MESKVVLKLKLKTNEGISARIVVLFIDYNEKPVYLIVKTFLCGHEPHNIPCIKRNNYFYCEQVMSFKKETLHQIIDLIKNLEE